MLVVWKIVRVRNSQKEFSTVIRKLAFGFSVLALALAGAAETYNIQLLQATTLNGTRLEAGNYQIRVDGDKAIFKHGKVQAETPVKVEKAPKKYESTIFKYDNGGGSMHLSEIRMAGTNTRLVFGAN